MGILALTAMLSSCLVVGDQHMLGLALAMPLETLYRICSGFDSSIDMLAERAWQGRLSRQLDRTYEIASTEFASLIAGSRAANSDGSSLIVMVVGQTLVIASSRCGRRLCAAQFWMSFMQRQIRQGTSAVVAEMDESVPRADRCQMPITKQASLRMCTNEAAGQNMAWRAT